MHTHTLTPTHTHTHKLYIGEVNQHIIINSFRMGKYVIEKQDHFINENTNGKCHLVRPLLLAEI